MRDLLGPEGTSRIRRLSEEKALLAFDFDGTLAPIVPVPSEAAMRPRTAELLRALVRRYDVAVITGRSIANLRERMGGVDVPHLIGNHGVEPSPFMAEAAASVATWGPLLAGMVDDLPGVEVENKRHSLSIHYRDTPSDAVTRAAILAAIARLPVPVRTVTGLNVVNVLPKGAPDKGTALERLQGELGATAVLFAGDDITDEDAFQVIHAEPSLGVRIGGSERSAAKWFLQEQASIDALLERFVALRG